MRKLAVMTVAIVALAGGSVHATGTFSGTETRATTNPADQHDPALSGDIVVYTDYRVDGYDSETDVYYTDVRTGAETPVTTAAGPQQLPDISGDRIVYTNFVTGDVEVYSISTAGRENITASSPGQAVSAAIDGNLVAWQDNRDGNFDIYARDLAAGIERQITATPGADIEPAVSGSRVVWKACVSGTCDIVSYDWSTGVTTMVASTPGDLRGPDIDGDVVVYHAFRDNDMDVYAYDLRTRTESRLSLPGEQRNANVSGAWVSFEGTSTGDSDVALWHLPTGSVFNLTVPGSWQFLNDIDRNRVVYADDRNGNLDIYRYDFTATFPPPERTVEISARGETSPVNLRARIIRVTILSTPSFDARTVLPGSVCFGSATVPAARDCTEAHGRGHLGDVDGDGDIDLVLHYETAETGIAPGDTTACLTGTTTDGTAIKGCTQIRTR